MFGRIFGASNKDNKDQDKEKTISNNRLLEGFEKAKFGDIIYAKRYESKEVIDYHENGPFIVLSNEGDMLICYQCTSKKGLYRFKLMGYYEPLEDKNTYVQYKKIETINKEDFLYSFYTCVNEEDKIRIKKHLSNGNTQYYFDGNSIKKYQVQNPINIGVRDVIYAKDSFYLILDENADYYFGLFVFLNEIENTIDLSRLLRNSFKKVKISKNEPIKYINTVDEKQFKAIEIAKNSIKRNNLKVAYEKKGIEIGYLLSINNIYYYVYNISKDDVEMFECELMDNSTKDTIMIDTLILKPYFNKTKTIKKNIDSFEISNIANQSEILEITQKRKRFLKSLKYNKKINNTKKEKKTNKFETLNVIESTKILGLRYLIINIDNEQIKTISFDAFVYADKVFYKTFDINDDSLSLSRDVTNAELVMMRYKLSESRREEICQGIPIYKKR